MRNNPLYRQLSQTAFGGNFTIEQVQSFSAEEVIDFVGASDLSSTFIENMKRVLVADLQSRDDEANKVFVKDKLDAAIKSRFPDFQMERGRENDKPYLTIWLKGQPNA